MNINNGNTPYKYLTVLAMAYMMIKLATILLIYKVISIGSISFTASTIVIPFWFFLGTIIAETYGYAAARHIIWMAIICQVLLQSYVVPSSMRMRLLNIKFYRKENDFGLEALNLQL